MSNKRLSELPIVEPRNSQYELDDLINKLSAVNVVHDNGFIIKNDFSEALLCLANEIKELKSKL